MNQKNTRNPENTPNQGATRIAYITAGAAGMYCGSCMHDNTLATALQRQGADAVLIPMYTPIRTDEEDVSVDRIFFGGVNVFLQQKIPLFRHLPGIFDRVLDQPWLIRWATSKASEIDPAELGALTVSMLRGMHGNQRKEVSRLCDWLGGSLKPDVINFSNMLIAGCVPEIRRRLKKPVVVTLQGDDVFLEDLPPPHREKCLEEIRKLAAHVDGFVTYSDYYADFMADYFSIPRDKIRVTPLCIDTSGFQPQRPQRTRRDAPAVGYLARLAPEKGFHLAVDAFLELRQRPGMQDLRLRAAGWLGDHQKKFVDEQMQRLKDAGAENHYEYAGAVDLDGKHAFLQSIDVLSTPTVYHDPKGLFVLEALAAGVPVVQPAHGAFPEMVARTGGGLTFRPGDTSHHVDCLHQLLTNSSDWEQASQAGHSAVHTHYNSDRMAANMLEIYNGIISQYAAEEPS